MSKNHQLKVWIVRSEFYDDHLLRVFSTEALAYKWMRSDIHKNPWRVDDHQYLKNYRMIFNIVDEFERLPDDEFIKYSYYVVNQLIVDDHHE